MQKTNEKTSKSGKLLLDSKLFQFCAPDITLSKVKPLNLEVRSRFVVVYPVGAL